MGEGWWRGGGGRGLKGVEFNPSHNLGWSTINMYNLKVTDIGNYALKKIV